MSNVDGMFNTIIPKLGVKESSVILKSKEFHRLLLNKCSLTNVNDICKIVLCVDVASSLLSHPIDKDVAIKLSGLKKTSYRNTLHNMEKLLNLDKELTISELCVQFSCTIIKEFAENIWLKYKQLHPALSDNNHPLYIVMSVYTACKLKKVKIDKQKLIALSHSTAAQFKELENNFQKFASSLGLVQDKKGKKNSKKDSNNIQEVLSTIENLSIKSPTKQIQEEVVEDYITWKNRILEEAFAALSKKRK